MTGATNTTDAANGTPDGDLHSAPLVPPHALRDWAFPRRWLPRRHHRLLLDELRSGLQVDRLFAAGAGREPLSVNLG